MNIGLFTADNLNDIPDPVAFQTWVGLTTDGQLYVYNGSGYTQITGSAPGAVVDSISKTGSPALTGDVTLSQGANVTLTQAGQDISIAASGGGGGGVDSVAVAGSPSTPLTGDVTFSEGSNITLTQVGQDIEIASSGGGSSDLSLVSAQVLNAAATSIDFSGLDGNADGTYRLLGVVKVAVNGNTLSLLVNGVTTNLNLQRIYTGPTSDSKSSWELLGPFNSGAYVAVDFVFHVKANPNSQSFARFGTGQASVSTNGTTVTILVDFAFMYNDTSTNITSLTFVGDQTNGLANGSYLRLYKYAQTAGGGGGSGTLGGASVQRAAAQTIGNTVYDAISFDTEDYDTDGYFSGGSPTRITIPATGTYLVTSRGVFALDGGTRECVLRLNGSTEIGSAGNTFRAINFSSIYNFTSGDYIELLMFIVGGGTTQTGSGRTPAMQIERLR